jgi:hypothetical protein
MSRPPLLLALLPALLLGGIAPATARAAAAAAPLADASAAGLRPYTVSYDFIAYGITVGTLELTLRRNSPEEWTYLSRSQPHGLFRLKRSAARTLSTRMIVDPLGVRPLLSTDTEEGASAPQSEVHFDWAANRATGRVEGQAIDMALRPGVQDDLSAQIALIQALGAGQTPTGISVFDKNGIRDYSYTRVGTETLHTPLGDVATIIYRTQKANAPRNTRYWCAPAYGYIPLRVEQRRLDKEEWTMEVRSLQRDPAPSPPALP